MKPDWNPDELTQYWTLSSDERELLGNKAGATRLSFTVLLKAFQCDGRFPERRADIAASVVAHLARQTGVPAEAYTEGEWSERTQRYQRAQIRQHCGFRVFGVEDEPTFVAWLSERVSSPNPEAEALKITAYHHLRSQRIEPPPTERLHRLLRKAVGQCEERLVRETAAQLSPATCAGLDALVKTQASEDHADEDQLSLFPVRSELAVVKDGAGAVKVETVLDEIAKLKQLRALGLPEALFGNLPAKLITHYRQRAAAEKPRELRRHSPPMRYTLLAALCWHRQREITDNLVELLIHIPHRVGVRAQEKVGVELMKYAEKVLGKAKLLYKLAKAAKGQPDGVIKDVIYPVVSEETLEDLIREAEAAEKHEHQPRAASAFVENLRLRVETALTALDASLPTDSKVKIVITKKGKGRLGVTPLDEQPEPPNMVALTAALVQRWPMTNLLDILKETELRVRFTEAFRTIGTREGLSPEVLQRRLLLCLYGLGTNAGLKRMCSGGTEDRYTDLQYIRRRYITKEHLRAAIAQVCNAIFRVRKLALWGEGTTACASDSKQFGAWDQNLMTEWHARYGGPGVMIY